MRKPRTVEQSLVGRLGRIVVGQPAGSPQPPVDTGGVASVKRSFRARGSGPPERESAQPLPLRSLPTATPSVAAKAASPDSSPDPKHTFNNAALPPQFARVLSEGRSVAASESRFAPWPKRGILSYSSLELAMQSAHFEGFVCSFAGSSAGKVEFDEHSRG